MWVVCVCVCVHLGGKIFGKGVCYYLVSCLPFASVFATIH